MVEKSSRLKTADESHIQLSKRQVAQGKPVSVGVLRISSKQLFAGESEIEIDHNGMLYRLRQTSLGKLILTK